jgi:hypothetical protein
VSATADLTYEKAKTMRGLTWEYQADLLAKSGLEMAMTLLDKDVDPLSDTRLEPWARPWQAGPVKVTIEPCNAGINLNLLLADLAQEELGRPLNAGTVAILQANDLDPLLLDNLLDWMDTDAIERVVGSERLAYSGRNPSYVPRNAPLETLEEVHLVNGWENVPSKVMDENFTAWGKGERVNINFVGESVFKNLFPDIAHLWPKVLYKQVSSGFIIVSELQEIVGSREEDLEAYNRVLPMVTERSDTFRVLVEVQLPFVYQKRRFIITRKNVGTETAYEVEAAHVLANTAREPD